MAVSSFVLPQEYPEVPLQDPPIVLALCQLRFNTVPDLGNRARIEALRDHLAGEYPDIVEQKSQEFELAVGPPGMQVKQRLDVAHKLQSPRHPWWILVSPALATLVTPIYKSRTDFADRIARLREALDEVGQVPAITRVGVRIINRVTTEDVLADLPTHVEPEFLSASVMEVADNAQLVQSVQTVILGWEQNVARLGIGVVPPGFVPDPAVPAHDGSAWMLDIDTWNDEYRPVDSSVEDTATNLAENAYRLFRRVVREQLLIRFGGIP